MKNSDGLVALFTITAIALIVTAATSYLLSTGVQAKPIVMILVAVLVILDAAIVFILATQAEMNEKSVYCLLLFIGLSAMTILLWFSSDSIITAGLALGYGLVFFLADAVILMEPVAFLQGNGRPQTIIVRQAQPLYTPVPKTIIERQIETVKDDDTKYEIKKELDKKTDELKQGEQQSKREIKQDIQTVKKEMQDVKKEISQEVKKAIRQKRVPKEKTFFVASKTGKSLHRKNCIVLGSIPKKNRITFDNEKIAVKQGYKLCRVCFPTGKA
ncbi:MAG: hypothetical protein EPN86_00050 [Nanoarchaeota archaeon]|nr:MAG: hypothetical protein EPN86_00050 [Nanoarchaeota archaeon]